MNEDEEVLIIIILVCYFGFCNVNINKKKEAKEGKQWEYTLRINQLTTFLKRPCLTYYIFI